MPVTLDFEIFVGFRGTGKTTKMLEWLKNAPEDETRVLICHSSHEALRLYQLTSMAFKRWQFLSIDELLSKTTNHLRGLKNVVIGIDNLDLVLPRIFNHKIGAVSMTIVAFRGIKQKKIS